MTSLIARSESSLFERDREEEEKLERRAVSSSTRYSPSPHKSVRALLVIRVVSESDDNSRQG